MFDGGISLDSTSRDRCNPERLIIGEKDVWVLVARPGEDVAGLLQGSMDGEGEAGLWICRGVLDGGVVLLKEGEPTDPFLSDLIRAEDEEWA